MIHLVKRHSIILSSITVCLLSLHMVSMNRTGTGEATIVKTALDIITKPVQGAIVSVRGSLAELWQGYVYLIDTRKANEAHEMTIAGLVAENNRLREVVALNARLKELLAFKREAAFRTVAARILTINTGSGWIRTATLDKGGGDGIGVDMTVVSPRGLVGRIINVTGGVSRALLLTDPRSSIDVVLQRTRVKGIAEGTGGNLRLKYIRQLEDVRVGDRVISAGISGIYPKGLFVGEVISVEKGADNFYMDIKVRPGSDINMLEEVLIATTAAGPKSEQTSDLSQ